MQFRLEYRSALRQTTPMNIIFLGSGAFGIPALDALAASTHRILHVVSQPDRPAGRGKHLMPTPVSQWVLEHQVPLTATENANAPDVLTLVRSLHSDSLVVIAFGQKLSEELLAVAPHRAINLHSSLLPKYRGAAPINWAIIHNDPAAGVCVINVTAKMDAGDILASASTPIGPAETAGELHDRLALLGAPLVVEVLDRLAHGTATRTPQDESLASRAPKLSREMAWVDFTQPAALVSAHVRGLSPWPGVHVELFDPAGRASRHRHAAQVPGRLLRAAARPRRMRESPSRSHHRVRRRRPGNPHTAATGKEADGPASLRQRPQLRRRRKTRVHDARPGK